MELISLNVGQPKKVNWNGKTTVTSIFKYPVEGKKLVANHQVEGDKQADLRYHGGENKAVYAYDSAHYDFWKTQLERETWEMGLFGENLTTQGLLDKEVGVGDVFQIGSVKLQAVQPRFPCFKLNIRFEREDMLKQFRVAMRYGIYFKIIEEGQLEAGDLIRLVEKDAMNLSIQNVAECLFTKGKNQTVVQQILQHTSIPNHLKDLFRKFVL